jgi:uncharacterized protein (DUF2225 family)
MWSPETTIKTGHISKSHKSRKERIKIMEVHVNYLAVLVAAIANYIIATIWYAAISGNLWKKLTGITEMKPAP